MLKVNTKNISIEEFAKKYGLTHVGETDISGKCYETGFNPYVSFKEKEEVVFFVSDSYCDDQRFLNLLFDMITNGDLIKE